MAASLVEESRALIAPPGRSMRLFPVSSTVACLLTAAVVIAPAPAAPAPATPRMDPQAQVLLRRLSRAPKPALAPQSWGAYVAAVRQDYHGQDNLAGVAQPVLGVEDRTIRGPGSAVPVPVRIYRPASQGRVPVLVWFHGGDFVAGDLDTHDRPLRALANRSGCVVVSVGYRLAPENPYPAAVEDARAAIAWVGRHAGEIGGDARRIAVGGDGAGGNVATVAAMLAREHGDYPRIALQILLYPDTDARAGYNYGSWRENDGFILDRAEKDRQLALYLPEGVDRTQAHVSPALAPPEALRRLPPALVITGERDPQRDEGELYASRLQQAGVSVSTIRYPGMIHGFFRMAGVLDAGGWAIDQVAKAVVDVRPVAG